ncbi:MAG: type II secretion system F family protein [Planctomycetota bacterium]
MPVYDYKALLSTGETTTGILTADTAKEAREQLRHRKLFVTDLTEAEKKGARGIAWKFSRKRLEEVSLLTRQLATLLGSGIQIADALSAMIEQIRDPELSKAFRDIREKITQGMSFGEALAQHPRYFDNLYVNMVKAGEASGNLDIILKRLADYTQKQRQIHGKISAAIAYPLFMVAIGMAVVAFLVMYVIPQITKALAQMGQTLPLATRLLMAVSGALTTPWILAILIGGVFAGSMLLRLFLAKPANRLRFDRLLLGLPVLGPLILKQEIARFADTLATLLKSGITVLQGLEIVKKLVHNQHIAHTLEDIRKRIVEGEDIAGPFAKSAVFPPMVSYMIAIGEESGDLDNVLTQIADAYNEEVDQLIQKATALLQPVLICCLAGVVGFIVFSVLSAVLNLSIIKR